MMIMRGSNERKSAHNPSVKRRLEQQNFFQSQSIKFNEVIIVIVPSSLRSESLNDATNCNRSELLFCFVSLGPNFG